MLTPRGIRNRRIATFPVGYSPVLFFFFQTGTDVNFPVRKWCSLGDWLGGCGWWFSTHAASTSSGGYSDCTANKLLLVPMPASRDYDDDGGSFFFFLCFLIMLATVNFWFPIDWSLLQIRLISNVFSTKLRWKCGPRRFALVCVRFFRSSLLLPISNSWPHIHQEKKFLKNVSAQLCSVFPSVSYHFFILFVLFPNFRFLLSAV